MGAGGIKRPMGGMPTAQNPVQRPPTIMGGAVTPRTTFSGQVPPQNPMQQPSQSPMQGIPMHGGKGGMPGAQGPAGTPQQAGMERFQQTFPSFMQRHGGMGPHDMQQPQGIPMHGGKGGMPGANSTLFQDAYGRSGGMLGQRAIEADPDGFRQFLENYRNRGLGSITPSAPITTPESANLPTSVM